MKYLPPNPAKTENQNQSKSKSTLSCLLAFVFHEIKISLKKGKKVLRSAHGLHRLQSAFWGDC